MRFNINAGLMLAAAVVAALTAIVAGYSAGEFYTAGFATYWHELVIAVLFSVASGAATYAALNIMMDIPPAPRRQDPPAPRAHCRTDWRDNETL